MGLSDLFHRPQYLGHYGWRPSVPDFRDRPLGLMPLSQAQLPSKIDLEPVMPAGVFDQGNLGSCTGQTWVGMVMALQIKSGARRYQPSRLFNYYMARELENTVMEDAGAMLRTGAKVLNKFGAPPESIWPYRIERFRRRPSPSVFRAGLRNLAVEYRTVAQSEQALKTALAAGYPTTLGFAVYDSMETAQVARSGIIPFPRQGDKMLGGHAVMIVGYDDSTRMFKIRNSWGAGWGQGGYGYIPYDYVTHPYLAADFWVLERIV